MIDYTIECLWKHLIMNYRLCLNCGGIDASIAKSVKYTIGINLCLIPCRRNLIDEKAITNYYNNGDMDGCRL